MEENPTLPTEWNERFLIKRINEEDIVISLEERDQILTMLNAGTRFVQIGKYTIMLNSIRSIDPFYGPDNVPPRPQPDTQTFYHPDGRVAIEVKNQDLIDLWDKTYGPKLLT